MTVNRQNLTYFLFVLLISCQGKNQSTPAAASATPVPSPTVTPVDPCSQANPVTSAQASSSPIASATSTPAANNSANFPLAGNSDTISLLLTDCGSQNSTGTDNQPVPTYADISTLIEPPKKAECASQGKVYDRKSKDCFPTVALDMSWCTDVAPIRDKFQQLSNAGLAVAAELTRRLVPVSTDPVNGGFTIEQCGVDTSGNKPVVTLRRVTAEQSKVEYYIIRSQ